MAFVLTSISGNLISAASAGYAPTNSADVSAIASSYAESAVSGKADSSALSSYALSSDVSGVIDTVSSNSASWGGGGIDSATCSAIASSYAESAASSKLDSTAFNSADFYTTANESGYIGSAYVESSISAYQPLSGMSAYESSFSAGDGLEFVQSGDDRVLQVEAPVDIVAGPGIVIDNPDGNTLRVSVAQNVNKVLWTGSLWDSNKTANLVEPASNFEYVLLHGYVHEATARGSVQVFSTSGSSYASLNCGNVWYSDFLCYNANSTVLNLSGHNHAWINGGALSTGTDGLVVTKIVGCARTASAQ